MIKTGKLKIFESATFKKIFLNAGILASGSVISSLIGLVSFALIARVLKSELFGVLALVQAYALIIDKVLNFQSWQAIIKYGSKSMIDNDLDDLKDLLKFGFVLDIATAILASLVGFFFAYLIGDLLGWSDIKMQLASFFSIVILFNIEGTPTAILRLFDSFKHFSISSISTAIVKFVLVVAGYVLDCGIWYFVIITMISQIVGYLYLLISSLLLLRKNNIIFKSIPTIADFKKISARFEGLWKFIWTTNFHGTVRMLTLNLDVVLIDSLLGSVSTGLYQVAKQFAKVFTQVSQPLYKSIYPELTKLWAKGEILAFKGIVKKFTFLALSFGIVVWIVFLIGGNYIIQFTVGLEYIDSLDILLWYLLGVTVSVGTFSITPAVLAIGFPNLSFKALLIATILYFVSFFALVRILGVLGAGISYLLLYIYWLVIMYVFYIKYLKKTLNAY